jgi:hypothetical protein
MWNVGTLQRQCGWLSSTAVAVHCFATQVARDAEAAKKGATARSATQPDDLIDFVQLKSKKGLSQIEIEDEVTTGGWLICYMVHLWYAEGHAASAFLPM